MEHRWALHGYIDNVWNIIMVRTRHNWIMHWTYAWVPCTNHTYVSYIGSVNTKSKYFVRFIYCTCIDCNIKWQKYCSLSYMFRTSFTWKREEIRQKKHSVKSIDQIPIEFITYFLLYRFSFPSYEGLKKWGRAPCRTDDTGHVWPTYNERLMRSKNKSLPGWVNQVPNSNRLSEY